jgi:hypothetical protein
MAPAHPHEALIRVMRQEESSFFEKKEAKKLCLLGWGFNGDVGLGRVGVFGLRRLVNHLSGWAAKPRDKVFLLLFFHKKKILACLPLAFFERTA